MSDLHITRIGKNWFDVSINGHKIVPPDGCSETPDGGFTVLLFNGDSLRFAVAGLEDSKAEYVPRGSDVKRQAEWELFIERFEEAVKIEKEKLRNRRHWFPWRIRIINVNEVKR